MGSSALLAEWIKLDDLHPARLDAGFYQHDCIRNERAIRQCSSGFTSLQTISRRIFKGAFFVLSDNYRDRGIPFLRTLDIKSRFVTTESCVYLTPETHSRESKTAVFPGNLVLAKTGASIGYSAVVPDWLSEANICQDLVGVRVNGTVDSYFLNAFLSSPHGQVQAIRWGQGNAHPHLGLGGIREWLIPSPTPRIQAAIGNKVRKSEFLKKQSFQEKSTVRAEIARHFSSVPKADPGLTGWTTTTDFDAPRINADCYLPGRVSLYRHLRRSHEFQSIGELVQLTNDRARFGEAEFINYVEIGDLSAITNQAIPNRIAARTAPASAKKAIRIGDVLVSTVRPNLKANGVVIEVPPGPLVASTAIAVLRGPRGAAGFILACFTSDVVTRQLLRWCTGSTYPVIDEEYVMHTYVPRLEQCEIERLGELWMGAIEKLTLADSLFANAKADVEALIGGTLEEVRLLAEGEEIATWLAEHPLRTDPMGVTHAN